VGWAEASMEAPIRDHIGVGPTAGNEAPLSEGHRWEVKGSECCKRVKRHVLRRGDVQREIYEATNGWRDALQGNEMEGDARTHFSEFENC